LIAALARRSFPKSRALSRKFACPVAGHTNERLQTIGITANIILPGLKETSSLRDGMGYSDWSKRPGFILSSA
jgi:hypothetical protein